MSEATPPKQIRLAINLLASGRHNASWKTLDGAAGLSTDIDTFTQIAATAERGLLDGIFLAEARQRKADLDDQLDLEHLKGALAELLGVDPAVLDLARELPYDQIPPSDPEDGAGHVRREKVVADARSRAITTKQVLLEYINFNIDRYPDGVDHLVDWLVPELQSRHRFRTAYESTTFRGNLGLPAAS